MLNPGQLFTINEARRLLGVGRTFLYSQIRAGRLRAVKVGRATRIFGSDIAQFQATLPELNANRERAQ